METLEDVISCVIERGVDREPSPEASASATAAGAAGPSPNSSTATATTTAPGKDSNGEPKEVAVDVELVHFKRRACLGCHTILTEICSTGSRQP
jgi:hypothetical protein